MNSYYGQPPQREENNNLGIAVGALGAGALAGFGGRALFKNINARRAKAQATGGPRGGQGGAITRDNPTAAEVYGAANKKYPDPGVGKDVEYQFPSGGADDDMLMVDKATGKLIRRGGSTAASYAELESSPKIKTAAYEEGSAVDKLMKSLLPEVNKEAGQMTATESSPQTRALAKQDDQATQAMARGILSELKEQPAAPVKVRGAYTKVTPETLVQVQKSREPLVAVNAMETVNTAEQPAAQSFLADMKENVSSPNPEKLARIEANRQKDLQRIGNYMSDVLEAEVDEGMYETLPAALMQIKNKAEQGTITADTVNDFRNWSNATFKNDPVVLNEINEELNRFNEIRKVAPSQQPETLVQVQESREPLVAVNSMETVNTADDQSDGRFLRNLQRNEDVNMAAVSEAVVDNKEAILDSPVSNDPFNYPTQEAAQANQVGQVLEVQGPLTAQETLDAARNQMVSLRQELEAKGFKPGTTKFERALAKQFKTKELSKTGELSTTGKSLNNVTLPAGPMRQTIQGVETSESPSFFSLSVVNVGEDPFSNLTQAASGSSIRGRSRIQNQPDQFRQRFDSKNRPIEDDQVFRDPGGTNTYSFGEELSELEMDVPSSQPKRFVKDPITGMMTLEFVPKNQRVINLFQGEGQPTKKLFVPDRDPGGVGIYGEERSFAAGPITKYGAEQGKYTLTAQRKPTDLPYTLKKWAALTDLSTQELQSFASKEKNPKAATVKAAMAELDRRETSKRSMEASEAVRRANIEGRDPQMVLRSLGFGV
jgi:hypothetical protein